MFGNWLPRGPPEVLNDIGEIVVKHRVAVLAPSSAKKIRGGSALGDAVG